MADKWNSVNDLLPPEGRVVEVLVQQGYVALAKFQSGKWLTTNNSEMRLYDVRFWQDGDRDKIDRYIARTGK